MDIPYDRPPSTSKWSTKCGYHSSVASRTGLIWSLSVLNSIVQSGERPYSAPRKQAFLPLLWRAMKHLTLDCTEHPLMHLHTSDTFLIPSYRMVRLMTKSTDTSYLSRATCWLLCMVLPHTLASSKCGWLAPLTTPKKQPQQLISTSRIPMLMK